MNLSTLHSQYPSLPRAKSSPPLPFFEVFCFAMDLLCLKNAMELFMTSSIVEKLAYTLDLNPNVPPRRIVTRSGVRVRGIFPSRRFDREMHWEAPLEREVINRLEASWWTADAATQPITMLIPSLTADGHHFRVHPRLCASRRARTHGMRRMQASMLCRRSRHSSQARCHQAAACTSRH